MTTTLAMICRDGIVVAADRRTSAGYLIVDKKSPKIFQLDHNIALTTSGSVSDIQQLLKFARGEIQQIQIQENSKVSYNRLSNFLTDLIYYAARDFKMIEFCGGFILAMIDENGMHIGDIGSDGSLLNFDDYCSTGSGSIVTLGVLETLYKKNLSIEEGVALAKKAISASISRDMPTGDGIDIMILKNEKEKTN